jgi:AraC-like DNA-binding protein
MYLYIKLLTSENSHLGKREFLHFIPFILVVIHRSLTDPLDIGREGGHDFRNPEQITNFIYYSLVTISLIIYTIITFRMIIKHKSNLQNIYSYKDSRYTLNWINAIAIMFLLIFTFSLIAGVFNAMWADINIPYRIQFIGSVVFIYLASFFGVNQPIILIQGEENQLSVDSTNDVNERYKRSRLSKKEMASIENKILDHIKQKKPYLNSTYSIDMLSGEVGFPRHHITQVININLNKNFYTLINELRIQEVIKRMVDSEYAHMTLLGIAFDSGFNSKSAFNRAFKQTTGMTPTEFKSTLRA